MSTVYTLRLMLLYRRQTSHGTLVDILKAEALDGEDTTKEPNTRG